MKTYQSDNINQIYKELLQDLYQYGSLVNNTYELLDVCIELTNINECIINNKIKSPSLLYLLAENVWYAQGSNSMKFISKFAKKWATISDDGISSNSAYGYIIQNKFGFNQVNKIISMLKKAPETRRACIIINDANENVDTTKDEQCTMFLQFYLRCNALHLTVHMRSNDVILGLPYDIPAFIGLQIYIADKLGVELGIYTHIVGSMHCYLSDLHKVENIITDKIKLPKYHIDFLKLYDKRDYLYTVGEYFSKDIFFEECIKLNLVSDYDGQKI